jgi:hypothetical protein
MNGKPEIKKKWIVVMAGIRHTGCSYNEFDGDGWIRVHN